MVIAVPTRMTKDLTQACGSFCAKWALEYPPSREPAVMTMACGQTIALIMMKVMVATPLMTPPNIQLLGISATARGSAHPERESVSGVGRDGRNAGKQERRKGHETSAAGDGVDSTAEGAGEKEEDGVVHVQTEVLSRIRFVLQKLLFPAR